jgi:hypothetical protein
MATAPTISVSARAADARLEIVRLREAFSVWLAGRRKCDPRGLFTTPLAALDVVVGAALAGLEAALPAAGPAVLADLEACRRVERGTVWLRRVWQFFRWRFDQRDPPTSATAELLAAADEMVWSCYRPAFGDGPVPTPPLAYVEDRYSPFAVPRVDPPPDLRFDVDAAFLTAYLSTLPIPVVGLPPACVEQPWWLIFAAHEIGHHVQYDLLPKAQLVGDFEAWLADALGDPLQTGAAARWAPWSPEIFADTWSILTTGPAALWALVALEAGDEARLLQPYSSYPSTFVRLALMAGLLTRLGLEATPALRGLNPGAACVGDPIDVEGIDLRAQLATDLALVPTIVEAVVTRPVVPGRTLSALAGWDVGAFTGPSGVRKWIKGFGAADAPAGVATREAPRQAVAGAIWAWAGFEGLPEAARKSANEDLRRRVVAAVAASHEVSVRAADTTPAAAAVLGARLSALVLQAPEPKPLAEPR